MKRYRFKTNQDSCAENFFLLNIDGKEVHNITDAEFLSEISPSCITTYKKGEQIGFLFNDGSVLEYNPNKVLKKITLDDVKIKNPEIELKIEKRSFNVEENKKIGISIIYEGDVNRNDSNIFIDYHNPNEENLTLQEFSKEVGLDKAVIDLSLNQMQQKEEMRMALDQLIKSKANKNNFLNNHIFDKKMPSNKNKI